MPDVLDLPTETTVATDLQQPRDEVRQPATKPQRATPVLADPKTRELAKALYLQGQPYKEIEAATGVRQGTIRGWAMRDEWSNLVKLTKAIPKQVIGRMSVNVNVASPAASEQSARVRNALGAAVESQAMALAASETRLEDLPNTPARQGQAAVLKTIADAASTIFDWDSQHTPGIIVIGDVEGREPESTPIDVAGSVEQLPESADTTTGGVPTEPTGLT
jgi:hypothetical protein